MNIYPDKKMSTGIRVNAEFKIGLNKRDLNLLLQIQKFFEGVGTISVNNSANAVVFKITKISDILNVVIPHFIKYPLLSQKLADFKLFLQIIHLLNKGAHLSIEGLKQIVNIKASLNRGNSEFVISNFLSIEPVAREEIKTIEIPDPHWITGFVSGEGNFDAGIRKATITRKERAYLRFRVTQQDRDLNLMILITKYLGTGRIEIDKRDKGILSIVVGNLPDINNKIIPFFKNYPVQGVKYLDYLDWVKIANLISLGGNQTPEGINEIKKIEEGMNKGRVA